MSIADRTVINIVSNEDESSLFFKLARTPGIIPGRGKIFQLNCTGQEAPFQQMMNGTLDPDVVRVVGNQLYTKLEAHPAFKSAMTLALARQHNQVAPIYLHLESDTAESFPWETLHAQGAFLALDRRWPVGRIADEGTTDSVDRTFDEPLNIAVVLAAAGVSAIPEWEGLWSALERATFEVHANVFVCEDNLRTQIAALNGIPPNVSVDVQFVDDKTALIDALKRSRPHIVHFFCHGSNANGAFLQLAKREDCIAKKAGSIAIQPSELVELATSNPNIWLLTLNCCEGAAIPQANGDVEQAAASRDMHSLAKSLENLGFPAVIGMRERVASRDAHLFCRALYPAILDEVASCMAVGGCEIEWARALRAPRAMLCELHRPGQVLDQAALTCKEWTLPIIYICPGAFKLRPGQPKPGLDSRARARLIGQLNVLRKAIDDLKALGVPHGARQELEQLLSNTEQELYG